LNGAAFSRAIFFLGSRIFVANYFPKITVLEKWELAAM
jgi:hypothetical protein